MAGIFEAFLKGLLKGAVGKRKKRGKRPAAHALTKAAAISPAPTKAKAPARGHGEYSQEVVGESNYQPALLAIRASAEKPFHRARLVAEDDNPYDDQAVRVDVSGQTVGYLPRADARLWRRRRSPATCGAYLADAGNGKNLGVWLRF
jgi:hypothetical protein